VDIAPTILALAGANVPTEIDGAPLPLSPHSTGALPTTYPIRDGVTRNQIPYTYYSGGNGDFDEYFTELPRNSNWTWKTIRVLDPDSTPLPGPAPDEAPLAQFPFQSAFKYAVICTNERELYDLRKDPFETKNRINDPSYRRIRQRLDALFSVLQTCWGNSCREPFKVLHPNDTSVRHFWDTLNRKYDDHYDQIPEFSWARCERYQDYSLERNPFKAVLGTFPRGPDGKGLAAIQVTAAATTTTITTTRKVLGVQEEEAERGVGLAAVSEVERFSQPLPDFMMQLTDEQLYGPEGNRYLLA